MNKLNAITIVCLGALHAQDSAIPRHILSNREPLTAKSTRPTAEIALEYTNQIAAKSGLNSILMK